MEIRVLRYFLEAAREGIVTHAAEFKALGEITGGDIHIGCAESDRIRHLAQWIKTVQAQVPGIRVHLYSGDTNDLAERLDQGLLYFAVIAQAVDRLHITATLNLTCNGSILAREEKGYVLTFDKLADTGERSELCFRPLTPTLEMKLYVVWKKYQVFSPAAELLPNEMKGY